MPIFGLTNVPKQFVQLGAIKKGEMQEFTRPDKSKGKKPVDLSYFRITYKAGAYAAKIEKAIMDFYGDKPISLNIRMPYNTVDECWDAAMECYKQGGLVAKAGVKDTGPYWIFYRSPDDSEVLVRDGQPVGERGRAFFDKPFTVDMPIYYNAKKEPVLMQPVGRLQVVIPETAGLSVGYFLFQPGSPRDIRNISAELGVYESIARQYGKTIAGMPFKLIRREEEVTKNIDGKLSKGMSWVVHVELDGEFGRLALEAIDRLALPEIVDGEVEDHGEAEDGENWTPMVAETPKLASKNAPVQVIVSESGDDEIVEPIDPLGVASVKYAMAVWKLDEQKTRKKISTQNFKNPMAKAAFKAFVEGK